MWGQFLPRSSVALVVIFGLESPTLEGKPSSSCHIRDDHTSATLGLGKNCPHNKYFIKEKRNII